MHYLLVPVILGCYRNLFEEILIRHNAGIDIGDTSWCHLLLEAMATSPHTYTLGRDLREMIWQATTI